MRLERLRALARYNILTSIAVLAAAAAAQPTLAATIVVNAPDTDGVVIPDGDSLVNNSTISNAAGDGVDAPANLGSVTNSQGAVIQGTLHGLDLNGNVGAFTNAGVIEGSSEAGVSIDGTVDTFINSGTITGFGGVGIGGPVASFRNEAGGIIDGGLYIGVGFNSAVEEFYNAGAILGGAGAFGVSFDFSVDDFSNIGTITGVTGVYVGADAGAFTNAGTISGDLGVDLRGSVGSFRNEAGGFIEGIDENAVRFAGPVGDFYNAGNIIGGIANGGRFAYGATVQSFANAGSIFRGATFDDDVGVFRNEAGALIEGTDDEGVNFNASVADFYNAGTISGYSTGVFVGYGMNGTNAAGGVIASQIGSAIMADGAGEFIFDNAGTISGETGIEVIGWGVQGSRLTNSGTIEGTAGPAIHFGTGFGADPRDDRLTLLTGSRIFGGIDFALGNDTLDFSGFTGNTILDVSNLETVVAGATNYFWDQPNERIAIFDLTGPSSVGSGLMDVAGAVNGAIGGQLGGGQGGGAPLAYAPALRQSSAAAAAESAVLSELEVGAGGTTAWATAFAGGSSDSSPVSVSNLFGGIVSGVHARLGGADLGVLGGYARGSYDVLAGQQALGTDTGLVGLYGSAGVGAVDLSFSLLGGFNGHASTREVVAGGITEIASAGFTSWFVSPSLQVDIPVLSGEQGDLSVVAAATYVGGAVSGYTETGSSMNLSVGPQTIGNLDGRIGLENRMAMASGVSLTAGGGLFALANFGSSSVPVTVLGQSVDAVTPGSSGYGVYAGIGLDTPVAGNAALGLSLDGSLRHDGLGSGIAKAKLEGSF